MVSLFIPADLPCFHYFCVHFGGYLQQRHQHYAPAVCSTSLSVRFYGVLRFPAGFDGHQPHREEALDDAR
jgi:hypothetical protein